MYINAALGAGSAAAVTHSILQQMTSNFNDYMYAPYIAGIYGMFKGAYGLSGMLGRRGFGLTHAATGIEAAGLGYLPPRIVWNYTNLTLFGVAGLVLKAFNAGMIGREVGGEFSDLANTVAGKSYQRLFFSRSVVADTVYPCFLFAISKRPSLISCIIYASEFLPKVFSNCETKLLIVI